MTKTAPLTLGVLMLLAAACGDDETSELDQGAGGADTRFFPPANGVHIAEAPACQQLQTAFQSRSTSLMCSKTGRTCPDLLRVQFQTPCLEYDEGSVEGCVDYFMARSSCDDLVETDCVVTAYPGTEPAGCP